jgi:hypothetical protein
LWDNSNEVNAPLPEFESARARVDIDVDALLRTIPGEVVVKRLILDIVIGQLRGRVEPAAIAAATGVELDGLAPLDDVSWRDYFRVTVFVAQTLCGRDQTDVGLREIGRRFYRELIKTPTGKLMLGRALGDAVRNVAASWAEFNSLGHIRSEFLGEREFLYHFEQFPAALAECMGVGVFEGMFRYHHMPLVIEVARLGPMHAILRVRW